MDRLDLAAIVSEERIIGEREDSSFDFEAFARGMQERAPSAWATENWCSECGRPARFGTGVSIKNGVEGDWRCLEHSEFAP